MKIKERLRLNTWISLGAIVLMMFTLVWSFRGANRADRNILLINKMQKAAFERTFLRDDYLMNAREEAKIQWYAKSETLRLLLESASERFTGAEDRALLREARNNFDATFSLFSEILEKHKQEESAEGKEHPFAEAELRLIGQVFLDAYALNDSIGRLHDSSDKAATKAQSLRVVFISFFIAVAIISIVINSILVNRMVAQRLTALQAGARLIGAGNLDYRIDEEGDDEFSDLAQANNEMAAKLKASQTATFEENLREEIIKSKETEKDIRNLNRELEQHVCDRTAQLEAANMELEAFSYSVSHDLRAPLRGIDGFSQALLEDYQDELDETAKSYLNRVRKATQHMGCLIDDMLKLSRVTRSEFHHESVDLSNIIRTISKKLEKINPDKTVDMIIQEGVFVNGDPSLLEVALENLMENTWKFTSRQAHPQVEFGTIVKEGKTACFIRDNGVGFDMAYVDKLFGAFQRLHTSSEFPGTGIGLATVQRIINRHGGKVWADAEVGKGATFYLTLPGEWSFPATGPRQLTGRF